MVMNMKMNSNQVSFIFNKKRIQALLGAKRLVKFGNYPGMLLSRHSEMRNTTELTGNLVSSRKLQYIAMHV